MSFQCFHYQYCLYFIITCIVIKNNFPYFHAPREVIIDLIAGPSCFAGAEDVTDDIDDDDEAHVEDSGAAAAEVEPGEEEATGEEDTSQKTQGSPDIDVTILFTKPVGNGMGECN